jgi:hypothetical protein
MKIACIGFAVMDRAIDVTHAAATHGEPVSPVRGVLEGSLGGVETRRGEKGLHATGEIRGRQAFLSRAPLALLRMVFCAHGLIVIDAVVYILASSASRVVAASVESLVMNLAGGGISVVKGTIVMAVASTALCIPYAVV